MVNLHDPVLTPQVGLIFVRTWHLVAGIYLWEFFTTLNYEWMVIRGQRPYLWTIWIYSLSRVACLLAVVLELVGLDRTSPINCQIWISFVATLFCVSLAAVSLLVVLRTIAIWNRNKAVMAMSFSLWGVGVAFHLEGASRYRSVWNAEARNCLSITSKNHVLGFIPAIFADMALLLIMLVGLILLRRRGFGSFSLTPLLWKQGITWLILALFCEAPQTVMALFSSNEEFNDLLLAPGLVMMIIATTRMHRTLVDYASTTDLTTGDHELGSGAYTRPKLTLVPSIS